MENVTLVSESTPTWKNIKDGVSFLKSATAEEALKFANLNFEVVKMPLQTQDSNLFVPDHFATVRTDNNSVLGVVGKDYKVIQNNEAFSFLILL